MQNLETMLHEITRERDKTWSYYAGAPCVGVVGNFLDGQAEGICPKCGNLAESYDSDEGPTGNHFLERTYECSCGNQFTERFVCVPTQIG